MVVEVSLGAVEGDGRGHGVDAPLESESAGRGKRVGPRERNELRDGRWSSREEDRPVFERLDRPAFDAAGQRGREVRLPVMGRLRHAHCDTGAEGN